MLYDALLCILLAHCLRSGFEGKNRYYLSPVKSSAGAGGLEPPAF
jgi:hypothetical protein